MTTRSSLVSELALPQDRSRALRIVAKSVYKELRTEGFDRSDVVGFASALIELLGDEMRTDGSDPGDS